jgi:mono/diheme cytochrome c family protein
MAVTRTKLVIGGLIWVVAAGSLLFAAASGMPLAPTADAALQFPAGEGQAQVQTACGPCHAVTIVTAARKSEADWERTVQNMVNRGARVSDADYDVIVDYLVRHFGAK